MTTGKEPRSIEDKEEKSIHAEDNPMEEAAPGECNSIPAECEFVSDERDGQAQDSEFKAHDEISDAFPLEEIPLVFLPDGLPSPVDPPGGMPLAHPFTIDTVVCIEDARMYEEVFVEEIVGMHGAHMHHASYDYFKQSALSKYEEKNGEERPRRTFKPDEIKKWYGVETAEGVDGKVLVRPIRERCKYYNRQVLALDGTKLGEDGHFLTFRNCTIRRSVGGAYLSLRDEAVYACDYRDPPDPKSVKRYLDDPDNKKLRDRPDLTLVSMFGTPGEDVRIEEEGTR